MNAAIRHYLDYAGGLPGWTRGAEAEALMEYCRHLAGEPVIVEVGSFLGGSAVLLAGAREVCGSGVVHCVDAFDGSGDDFSAPFYRQIAATEAISLRARFERNVAIAGVAARIRVHEGSAVGIGSIWQTAIDMLFLDSDQSRAGARAIFDTWLAHLKPGGILAVHNSSDREYATGHDGCRRVVLESVRDPLFVDVRCVGTTTFARRAGTAG